MFCFSILHWLVCCPQVWTSKQEAAEQLKQAAAKARTEEAAAAEAAAGAAAAADPEGWQVPAPNTAAAAAGAAGGSKVASKGWSSGLFGRWRMWRSSSSSSSNNGYVPLPEADPEAGLVTAAAAGRGGAVEAADAAAAAPAEAVSPVGSSSRSAGKACGGRVSQLTQALQHSTADTTAADFPNAPSPIPVEHSELLISNLKLPKTAAQQQQQQSHVGGSVFATSGSGVAAAAAAAGSAYERIMEQYEIKCEAVLTSVHQSMFKVSFTVPHAAICTGVWLDMIVSRFGRH
jgi:hypothetical protein